MAEEKLDQVEQKDEGAFEVEELNDETLEGVSGGLDPGNGCVNNAAHC